MNSLLSKAYDVKALLKKAFDTSEKKAAWRLWLASVLFLHAIFLPEYFALPSCIDYRSPLHLYRQNLAFMLLMSALPLLVGKIGGKCAFCLYGLCGIFNAVTLYSLTRFHLALDYTTLQILAITDASEVHEFCSSFLHWYDVLPFAFVLAAAIWCMRYTTDASAFSRRLGLVLVLPFLLAALPNVCRGKLSWFGKRNALCRFLLTSLGQFAGEMGDLHKSALNPQLPTGIRSTAASAGTEPILGVVVVGESARRANFQCYGYGRPTTPNLMSLSRQCLFFDDVIAPATSTLRCCVYMFSDAAVGEKLRMRYSVCDFLLAGGYQVGLYSNQRRSGSHESLGLLFHKATEKKYLMEEGIQDGYDFHLLSFLKNSPLLRNSQPTVLFLHTMGSHHQAEKRYPPAKAYFPPDHSDAFNAQLEPSCAEYLNHYDNSIRVTDELLGDAMAFLNSLSRPAFLLYLSDHAEILPSKDNGTIFRDASNPATYEIPFIVFWNEAYARAYPDLLQQMARNIHQPMQTDAALYAIASLAKLTWDAFPSSRDITSPMYAPAMRYLKETKKIPYRKRQGK